MAKSRRMSAAALGLALTLALCLQMDITAEAGNDDYLNQLRGGVATVLTPSPSASMDVVSATVRELNFESENGKDETSENKLVMTNVTSALNVRSEASATGERVGMLYKDCGGTILERKDGWTKLQSGNVIGWCSDEFLLFGEEALALANDVGKTIVTINTETLRVRKEPSRESGVYGLLPKGEVAEVLNQDNEDWICVDYEGKEGYVSAEYVIIDFVIGTGETVEEIKVREEAEKEAKRHVKYGAYTTDADTTTLLAAIIHCEAGGESYEGQVAVGAVVMNRVRSSAYPNTIHGVIYAPGQFTPAMTGKLDRLLESGNIYESCFKAAEEALSGVSNVGDLTHFRRNNGREGLVIGNHVFY